MSNKEKPVELIPIPPTGWKVKHGTNMGTSPGSYPKVDFAAGSGPHLVVFNLQDVTGVTPTFNATDPIWVQAGGSSPTQKGIDSQIADWAILDNGKTLVILDTNSQAGDLSYRIKADGYNTPLDPIIRNGGTVSPPPSFTTNQLLIGGAALLAAFVIGMLVHRMVLAK